MEVNFSAMTLEIQAKYHMAQKLERYFSADDYMWVLGGEVWRRLWFEYLREPASYSEPMELMGIRVQIDVNNPFKIKLFKEIK